VSEAAEVPDDAGVAPATAPIPVLGARPTLGQSIAPLRLHNFRLYFASQIFANTGGWMQRVAIDWLVLELTGSVALVGVAVALQFAPVLVLGPWAGVLSDRYARRRVLILTQTVVAVAGTALAIVVLAGVVQAWQVFAVAGLLGVTTAIDGPSRSAFVSEMVGLAGIKNAISLNSIVFHLGGLLGPAISGVLIVAVGSGWSIAINAVTATIALTALLLMRRNELIPPPRQRRARGQVREAVRYALRKPTIVWPLVLLAFVAVFGMNLPVLLAASASGDYGTGAAGYGLYSSLAAVGAFLGSVLSTLRRTLRLRGIVACTVLYGFATITAGLAPAYAVFLSALVALGIARLLFATAAESIIQLSTNAGIRGRIMAIYLMVIVGGQAAGGVLSGALAEQFGTDVAYAVCGGGPALAGIVVGVVLARRGRLRLRVDLRSPRRLLRIVPRGEG